jgi:hypothetical protein
MAVIVRRGRRRGRRQPAEKNRGREAQGKDPLRS